VPVIAGTATADWQRSAKAIRELVSFLQCVATEQFRVNVHALAAASKQSRNGVDSAPVSA